MPIWDELNDKAVREIIGSMYEKIFHWKKNTLLLPTGKAGSSFIEEATRLFSAWLN